MHVTELDNFIHKFKQLWKAGLTAHLDIDTHAGNAWVGLRLQLGPIHQPPQHVPHPPSRYHRGPSYQRRLAKRREARSQASPSSFPTVEVGDDDHHQPNGENEEAAEATMKHRLDDDSTEKATEEEESQTENSEELKNHDTNKHEQKDAEKAETTDNFECPICDFRSNWNNGLQVHMNRMHTVLEQIDGSIESDVTDHDDAEYKNTAHYWEKGRIGIAYHSFLSANAIIDTSDLSNREKAAEKTKLLESRKNAFGNNFKNFPPWKLK